MVKADFRFNEEQRDRLLSCWKRKQDRDIAVAYLSDVELIVAIWSQKTKSHPPTAVKDQITYANDLNRNALALLTSFEKLPQDVAGLMNTIWVRHKYGNAYFGMHEDACREDTENHTAMRNTLPPNFFQQAKITADFLRVTMNASQEMADILRSAKLWNEKDAEKKLLYSLAVKYETHFGKLPSAANARKGEPESASPFRKFVAELSKIAAYTLQFGEPPKTKSSPCGGLFVLMTILWENWAVN